ncbi:hypothetical protein BP6252_05657 [Coleophoma cylindrospora]|uniref:Uncharacterized protein n=1 Tax=Coleophoma cylindrospora TaxID=1849047 RepID=A0A3D8RUS1_9HELO|nr:hypothetical protein BP6252_05657 [Coleophoma cylindrospora]
MDMVGIKSYKPRGKTRDSPEFSTLLSMRVWQACLGVSPYVGVSRDAISGAPSRSSPQLGKLGWTRCPALIYARLTAERVSLGDVMQGAMDNSSATSSNGTAPRSSQWPVESFTPSRASGKPLYRYLRDWLNGLQATSVTVGPVGYQLALLGLLLDQDQLLANVTVEHPSTHVLLAWEAGLLPISRHPTLQHMATTNDSLSTHYELLLRLHVLVEGVLAAHGQVPVQHRACLAVRDFPGASPAPATRGMKRACQAPAAAQRAER